MILDESISLHALSGTIASTTIKLKGWYRKQGLIILVDSGSTHSFIDGSNAKQLGCVVQKNFPMRTTVSNKSHLMSYHSSPYFK